MVNKCPNMIEDKLGEILGYLSVLIGLHRQVEGLSLVPTNLPHLQFNQVNKIFTFSKANNWNCLAFTNKAVYHSYVNLLIRSSDFLGLMSVFTSSLRDFKKILPITFIFEPIMIKGFYKY